MKLESLIEGIECDLQGDPALEVEGLAYDSRLVKPGYVFIAMRGHALDGHRFINQAVEKGAVAVVAEEFKKVPQRIVSVRVPESRRALSLLAVRFYRAPFEGMNLIGITGTNGKTTTSYLLESILLAAGAKPGVLGTVNYRFPGHTCKAPVTTPESLEIMQDLRKMADNGVTDVVMEVSSHALDQNRTRDCPFRIAIFTNISRDHLDYHGSMDAYFRAKSLLFRGLEEKRPKNSTRAIINWDDPKGKELSQLTDAPVITYGLGTDCDVRAESLSATKSGLRARLISRWGDVEIQSSLIGDFNIYNILAATAAALSMDISPDIIASGITQLSGIPGRLELVKGPRPVTVVVDYAHTPDALLKVLKALRPLTEGRLITVFGCGGDRDQGKRPEMGRVAAENSDFVLITSDNPRTEAPEAIAAQIEEGVRAKALVRVNGSSAITEGDRYLVDLDRASAIRSAVAMAHKTDLILIAGKGHEDYQIIGKERRGFDDREVAAHILSAVGR